MPITFQINPDSDRIFAKVSGDVGLAELEEALNAMSEAPNFNPDYDLLTDARELQFSGKQEEIRAFGGLFGKVLGSQKGKSALLLDQPYETAIGMIHKKNVENLRRIEIFSTMEAALKWLESK